MGNGGRWVGCSREKHARGRVGFAQWEVPVNETISPKDNVKYQNVVCVDGEGGFCLLFP